MVDDTFSFQGSVEMSATNAKIDSLRSADTNLPLQARFLAAVSGLNPEILKSLRELSKAQTRLPTQRELKRWACV